MSSINSSESRTGEIRFKILFALKSPWANSKVFRAKDNPPRLEFTLDSMISENSSNTQSLSSWFTKGKSADTFAPVGPYFVSTDQIEDIQSLSIWSEVNGEMRQQGDTADMVFGVREIVSHLSQFMTLYPGDIIFTGTPSGVGDGMDPPRYLKPGDIVRIGVEGLGEQRQVIAPPR